MSAVNTWPRGPVATSERQLEAKLVETVGPGEGAEAPASDQRTEGGGQGGDQPGREVLDRPDVRPAAAPLVEDGRRHRSRQVGGREVHPLEHRVDERADLGAPRDGRQRGGNRP